MNSSLERFEVGEETHDERIQKDREQWFTQNNFEFYLSKSELLSKFGQIPQKICLNPRFRMINMKENEEMYKITFRSYKDFEIMEGEIIPTNVRTGYDGSQLKIISIADDFCFPVTSQLADWKRDLIFEDFLDCFKKRFFLACQLRCCQKARQRDGVNERKSVISLRCPQVHKTPEIFYKLCL